MSDTAPAAASTPAAAPSNEAGNTQPANADPAAQGTQSAEPKGSYEERLERLMSAQRQLEIDRRDLDVRLKKAEELEGRTKRYSGLDSKLSSENLDDLVDAIQELTGERFSDELLLAAATRLAARNEPQDPRKVAEEVFAQKERERLAKEEEEANKRKKDEEAKNQADYNRYVSKAKAALDGGKDGRFELCYTQGVDMDRFNALLVEMSEATGETPDPEVILDKIEAEHEARIAKAKKFARVNGQAAASGAEGPGSTVKITPAGAPLDDGPGDIVEKIRERNRKSLEQERNALALGSVR